MPSSGTDDDNAQKGVYLDKYCGYRQLYLGIGRNWIFVAPVMGVTPSRIKWNV